MVQDMSARLQRAYTLLKEQQKVEAYALLRPILKQQPDDINAWWLAANAAPTPTESIRAVNKVLELQPDHVQARQFLARQQQIVAATNQRLQEVNQLIQAGEKSKAFEFITPVLGPQPYNPEALWLAALSAPIPSESIKYLQRLLDIQPANKEARQMLAEQKRQAAVPLTTNVKEARYGRRKSRSWLLFGLLGILLLAVTGFTIYVRLSGNSFGLPIGPLFNMRTDLVIRAGSKPTTTAGTLVVGSVHEYRFVGHPGMPLQLGIMFASGGKTTKAVKLLDPFNRVTALPINTSNGIFLIETTLASDGAYILQLTGIQDAAQGAYVLQAMSMSIDMSQFDPGQFNFDQ